MSKRVRQASLDDENDQAVGAEDGQEPLATMKAIIARLRKLERKLAPEEIVHIFNINFIGNGGRICSTLVMGPDGETWTQYDEPEEPTVST